MFDLCCFAGLVRGLGVVLDLAIKDLGGRRHHRRTTSTPLRSATRGVRSLRRRYGASGITSNAPFAGEVQSNILLLDHTYVRFRGFLFATRSSLSKFAFKIGSELRRLMER